MERSEKRQNIVFQYFIWQFFDMPKAILSAWKNFLSFNLNYFSIILLLKTFFSPWKRYSWSYGRGFSFSRYFHAFSANLISRMLGAFVRIWLILLGILSEVFIFFAGIIVFLAWIFLPAFLIWFFSFGLKIIF